MSKKIIVLLTFLLVLVGCSTRREIKFNSGTGEFSNGKYSEKKTVEGYNMEKYIPKIKDEYLPYFLGWVDENDDFIDIQNIPKNVRTITVKWDEEKIVSYLKDKDAKQIVSVLNEKFNKSNNNNDLKYKFTWEEIEDKKYIVMNTVLIDQQLISILSNQQTRDKGRKEIVKIYNSLETCRVEVKKNSYDRYPVATRLSLDDEENTIIYESIDDRILINLFDLS